MCCWNRVFEEVHHGYGCRLHKTTFWDVRRRLSALRKIWWYKYDRDIQICLGETWCRSLEVRSLDTPAPRHPEITPGVTFCRDIMLKNLCLLHHWKIEIGQVKRSLDQQVTSPRITVWREFALHTCPILWMWKDASPKNFSCADLTKKAKG